MRPIAALAPRSIWSLTSSWLLSPLLPLSASGSRIIGSSPTSLIAARPGVLGRPAGSHPLPNTVPSFLQTTTAIRRLGTSSRRGPSSGCGPCFHIFSGIPGSRIFWGNSGMQPAMGRWHGRTQWEPLDVVLDLLR